jgi:hypothetical protein
MTTEQDYMNALRASHADEYFKEYPFINNQTCRLVFDAVFQLGWEAHGDAPEGVIERAKKLGVATVPVSEILDEMERLRAALSALQNAPQFAGAHKE